jgi:hypothetical protein
VERRFAGTVLIYDRAGGKVASFIGESDIREIEKAVAAQVGP